MKVFLLVLSRSLMPLSLRLSDIVPSGDRSPKLKVPLSHPSHSRFFPTKTSSSCRAVEEEGRPDEDSALNTKPLASTSRDALAVCGRKTKTNSGVSNGIGTPSQGKYLSRDTVPVGRSVYDTSRIPRRRAAAYSGRSPTHQNSHTNTQNRDSQVPQAGRTSQTGMPAHGRVHSGRYGAQTWRWMRSLV